MSTPLNRIADALESIAKSLEHLALPPMIINNGAFTPFSSGGGRGAPGPFPVTEPKS